MANILSKFELSSKSLRKLLSTQKKFEDRTGLGYDSGESSTSKSKQIKFINLLNKTKCSQSSVLKPWLSLMNIKQISH